ncbi:hypothetical protein I3843_03G027500 [Carya illinoinensis]|nr:hypothetical protein I3760_03G024400 [Carya illinoinensis]KAG7985480.1 hypothetical protein I3843_03G027500 [Carya illinoinensis]
MAPSASNTAIGALSPGQKPPSLSNAYCATWLRTSWTNPFQSTSNLLTNVLSGGSWHLQRLNSSQ